MPSGRTEGEKGKRYDLVFQCCPPPPRPAPLCLFPLRVRLHRYRRALCLPNTAGARDTSVPLIYPPFVTITALSPCLDHHVLLHPQRHLSPPCQSSSFFFFFFFSSAIKTQMAVSIQRHRFCKAACEGRASKMLHNVAAWLDVKVQAFTSDCCHIHFWRNHEMKSFAAVLFLRCGVPCLCASASLQ